MAKGAGCTTRYDFMALSYGSKHTRHIQERPRCQNSVRDAKVHPRAEDVYSIA